MSATAGSVGGDAAAYPRDALSGLPIIPIPTRYAGKVSGDRTTHYIAPVLKVSRKGKALERLLMITDKFIYLLKQEQTVTRCIGVHELTGLQLAQDNDQGFLLQCDRSVAQSVKQHDLALDRCPDRTNVLHIITTLFRCWTQRDLPVVVVPSWKNLELSTRAARAPTKEYNAESAIRPATPIHSLGDRLVPGSAPTSPRLGSPPGSPRPQASAGALPPADFLPPTAPARQENLPPDQQWVEDEPVPPPLSPSGFDSGYQRRPAPPEPQHGYYSGPPGSPPISPDLRVPAQQVEAAPEAVPLQNSTAEFYELEIASLQRQLQRLHQNLQESNAELSQRDEELRSLREESARNRREQHATREAREADQRKLQDAVSRCKQEVESLRDQLAERDNEIQRLRQQSEHLRQQEVATSRDRFGSPRAQWDHGTPNRAERDRDMFSTSDEADVHDLRARLGRARELYDSLCARMTTKDAEIRQLRYQLQCNEEELSRERTLVRSQEGEVRRLGAALQDRAREYESVQSELITLQESLPLRNAQLNRETELAALINELSIAHQREAQLHHRLELANRRADEAARESSVWRTPTKERARADGDVSSWSPHLAFHQAEREALLADVNQLKAVTEQRQLEIERLRERERDAEMLQEQNSRLLAMLPHSPHRTQEELVLARIVQSSHWRL